MSKRIVKIAFIFLIGMIGGVFSSQVLLPYFLEDSFLGFDSAYLARLASGPIYLTEKKEITVQENSALQDSVEKVKNAIVAVRTKTVVGEMIYGSGLVLTTDGLVVTLNELIPKGGSFAFFVDSKAYNYQILKRDMKNNLALLKLETEDLQTVGFADLPGLKIGERVFLLGKIFSDQRRLSLANEGIVKYFTNKYVRTSIFEESTLAGSALFNIKGELLGLNTIDKEGKVTAIPIDIIRNFAGF